MRMTLSAALVIALLSPTVVSAQEDAGDGVWPTATELRRELQGIGIVFALMTAEWAPGSMAWMGGRRNGDIMLDVVEFADGWRAEVAVLPENVNPWPDSIGSDFTVLGEVLSSVPIEIPEQVALMELLRDVKPKGCYELSVPGGLITVQELYGDSWLVKVHAGPDPARPTLCTDWLPIEV